MDLVDEQNRARAFPPTALLGLPQNLADLLHAGEHGAHRLEMSPRAAADHLCQRRLARARRTPEDQRRQYVGLERAAQRRARSERLLLSEQIVEGLRTHAV